MTRGPKWGPKYSSGPAEIIKIAFSEKLMQTHCQIIPVETR